MPDGCSASPLWLTREGPRPSEGRRLDASTGVIYYWLETGALQARKGPGKSVGHPRSPPELEAICLTRDRLL